MLTWFALPSEPFQHAVDRSFMSEYCYIDFFVYNYRKINKIRILILIPSRGLILIDSNQYHQLTMCVLCSFSIQSYLNMHFVVPSLQFLFLWNRIQYAFFLVVLVLRSEPRTCTCQTSTLSQSYIPRLAHY